MQEKNPDRTLVVGVLSGLTSRRARDYEGPETLWRDTLAKNPASFAAHNTAAVEADPDLAQARATLAVFQSRRGRGGGSIGPDETARMHREAAAR